MKEFLTISRQIDKLKQRGMTIISISYAKEKLLRYNYYNIINGFKLLFLSEETKKRIKERSNSNSIFDEEFEERYKDNISFEEVFSIYEFDTKLRMLFLKYITMIESEMRTHIAYEFSSLYNPYSWDDINFFDHRDEKKLNDMMVSIEKIKLDKKSDIQKHFSNKNEKMPMWAAVNTFDFGLLRTFYTNMLQVARERISNKYYKISEKVLITFLSSLNMYRNVCTHDNRILFYRIFGENKRIAATKVHQNMNIEKNNARQYLKGCNDLFSIVICFKYMLHPDNFDRFFNKISNLFDDLEKNLKVVDINDIYNSIGFPINKGKQLDWREIKNISLK